MVGPRMVDPMIVDPRRVYPMTMIPRKINPRILQCWICGPVIKLFNPYPRLIFRNTGYVILGFCDYS